MLVRTIVVGVVVALFSVSCGDDPPPSPTGPTVVEPVQPPVTQPAVTLTDLTLYGPTRFIDDPVLEVGETVQLDLDAEYSDGSTKRVTEEASWTSSNDLVATVAAGLVTGTGAGEVSVQARFESLEVEYAFQVEMVEPTLAFAFDPLPPAMITAGDTGHFRVNIITNGNQERLTDEVTSSAESVVRLDLEGDRYRYTGVNAGRAEIRVVHDGERRLTHSMTVQRPPSTERWRGIRVEPEVGRSGYVRPSWNVRDTDIYRQDGSPDCTAYTQTPITNVGTGDGLDREHIVALAEAWDSRPAGFSQATLRRIAEDHDNLTLATASANRSKGARDAAEWRPDHNGAWMANRVVEVKREYDLSVDPTERDWLERLLGSGPDAITCGSSGGSAPAHPPVQTFRNCTLMREAGWNRGVNQNGGTYRESWDDAERRTYGLNPSRDRDKDGHACE